MDISQYQLTELIGHSEQCQIFDNGEITSARRYLFEVDGVTKFYPSMTTILGGTKPPDSRNFLKRWREEEILAGRDPDEGAKRGNIIHEAAEELLLTGNVDLSKIPESVMPFWTALLPIFGEIELVIAVETPVYHPIAKWGGRIDLLVWMNGKIVLLDFKTKKKKTIIDEEGTKYYSFNAPTGNRRFCEGLVCEKRIQRDDLGQYHILTRPAKTNMAFVDKPPYADDYKLQLSAYMCALRYHNPWMREFPCEGELLFTSQDGKLYRMVLTLEEMAEHWSLFVDRARVYHAKHPLVQYWQTEAA
jgi:hypothetical protein